MTKRHVAGMIQGAGLFAIWFAGQMQGLKEFCDERGLEFPAPPELKIYPIAGVKAMAERCNRLMPDDMAIQILAVPETKSHKHFDRHGSEIPCETFRFLHEREGYGHVGMWKSPHGVIVSTQWIGKEDCRFQTRIHAPGTDWHGRTRNYLTEAEAIQGHSDAVAHTATEGPGTWLHENPRTSEE